MARALLLSGGSRGDIEPLLAIAAAHGRCMVVVQRDYAVDLPAGCELRTLPFALADFMPHFVRAFGDAPAGEHGFVTQWRALASAIAELIIPCADAAFAAANEFQPDLVLTTTLTLPLGILVAEKLDIPLVYLTLQPDLPTRYAPHPNMQPEFAAEAYAALLENKQEPQDNFLTDYNHLHDVFVPRFLPNLNDARLAYGLPSITESRVREILDGVAVPTIIGISPNLVPCPPDLPINVHIPGTLAAGYIPVSYNPHEQQPELCAYLDAGSPPVVVSFGSLSDGDGATLTRKILVALRASNTQRAVFLPSRAGVCPETLSEKDELRVWAEECRMLTVRTNVQYSWLLPRALALVCHGGAGAVGAALSAGAALVVVPFRFDQPFYASLVHRLELGAGVPQGPAADESAFILAFANAFKPQVKRNVDKFASRESNDAPMKVVELLRKIGEVNK